MTTVPERNDEMKKSDGIPRENDYDWGKTLGEGAFGTVVLGTVKSTGKVYAVKLIQKKFIMEKKNKEIVFRERQILNALKHPFVVTLHYTFQTASDLYFVMDYCANGELYEYIRKLGSFSEECARWYLAEIVVALEHIHSRGIVHRDLKPENILLTDSWHIKVIDFGTAKEVGRGRTSSFEGTPEYMSPELLVDKECDTRADLWALGIMLFQFITGKVPFRGATVWETMRKVREREFEPFPDFFPPLAQDLCEKLLVSDPDQRLGREGMEDLKAHLFFKEIDWENIISATPPPLEHNPNVPLPPEPVGRRSSSGLPNLNEVEADDEGADTPPTEGQGKNSKGGLGASSSDQAIDPENVDGNTAAWKDFIKESERVVRASLVNKKRRRFNVKKRQLLLTDAPRLIYVDPVTRKEMGTIEFNAITRVVAKDPSHFVIQTKKRDYAFEDKTKGAHERADRKSVV